MDFCMGMSDQRYPLRKVWCNVRYLVITIQNKPVFQMTTIQTIPLLLSCADVSIYLNEDFFNRYEILFIFLLDDWIGDSFCDDINNNELCDFDGGDCCGLNVQKNFCVNCTCLCKLNEVIIVNFSLKKCNLPRLEVPFRCSMSW